MNSYPKDRRPPCPVRGPRCTGFINTAGARACHPCSRAKRTNPLRQPHKPMEPDTGDAPALPPLTESTTVKGDACEISKMTTERVRTLEDLIRVCAIDTGTWEVDRFVCNKWEMGSVDRVRNKVDVTPLYQVKVWLKRKVAVIAARAELADLLADAKRRIAPRPVVARRKAPGPSGIWLELSIPDLHAGKLAWAKETGWENYDTKIAEQVFETAVTALLDRTSGYRFDRVLFPIGNDLLHSDNREGATTAGTPQDTDGRYQKTFGIVRRMMTRTIDRLRSIAPVSAVIVPGNHDTLSAWHLGDSLDCYFHQCSDVTVDNDPTPRKYVQHGAVMLMFTHGNKGKLSDYPLLMAAERPAMFGATRHREAHTGDKHHQKVEEYHGIKVRISPALCPPDAWHAENHYVGAARSAEAFVWHGDEGLIGTAHYTVRPPSKASEAGDA